MNKDITIGQLAKLMSVSINQIRYFERKEVLFPKYISESGYRMYGINEINILARILILRKLNISVSDIKNLFKSDDKTSNIALLENTISEISEQIASLTKMMNMTQGLIESAIAQGTYINKFLIKKLPNRTLCEYAKKPHGYNITSRDVLEISKHHIHKNIAAIEDDVITIYGPNYYYVCAEEGHEQCPKHQLEQGEYLCFSIIIYDDNMEDIISNFYSHAEKESINIVGTLIIVTNSMLSVLNRNSECLELQMRIQS